ncbi:hypothetical protein SSX86_020856 [Deinandra increscens subsp. villosa]|uniref:WW domain-containing protein n=1 Tax=Deinandra increscens subsp. villosa TaxID=3103831 RepID=A0AAP0CTT6_9ASTR
MTPPSMAAITASLERSLQSFSLNHHRSTTTAGDGGEESTNAHCHRSTNSSDATLELNSNITLPYHWEQCLDLKTGEIHYINWKTGMKSTEDPRSVNGGFNGYFYSDDYDYEEEGDDYEEEGDDYEEEGDGEESSYAESESSSVESSPAVSSSEKQKEEYDDNDDEDENEDEDEDKDEGESRAGGHVLVVAGCKGCFMYFMVPKQVGDCPKCCGQLLHFDRSSDN